MVRTVPTFCTGQGSGERKGVIGPRMVSQEVRGHTRADYHPSEEAVLPRMADLRFQISGKAELVSVGMGKALFDADQEIRQNPMTGQYFTRLSDETLQLLVLAPTAGKPIDGGRWLGLKFLVDDPLDPATVPLEIALVPRENTFAPSASDTQLWSNGFGDTVVIWPWMTDED